MSTTWIQTAWVNDTDGPYLVSAYDEASADSWAGVPRFHTDEVAKHADVREMRIEIPWEAVTALFAPPIVRGEVTA